MIISSCFIDINTGYFFYIIIFHNKCEWNKSVFAQIHWLILYYDVMFDIINISIFLKLDLWSASNSLCKTLKFDTFSMFEKKPRLNRKKTLLQNAT